VDTWAAVAAVVVVQIVLITVGIVKYFDDVLDVFVRDRGHLPYGDDGTTNGQIAPEEPKKRLNNEVLHEQP